MSRRAIRDRVLALGMMSLVGASCGEGGSNGGTGGSGAAGGTGGLAGSGGTGGAAGTGGEGGASGMGGGSGAGGQSGAGGEGGTADSGQFVAFISEASDLVDDDTNGVPDVFVRDRTARTTTRISLCGTSTVLCLGTGGDGPSDGGVSISDDGRFVAFSSAAANLIDDDTNERYDIFVRDLMTDMTTRISLCGTSLVLCLRRGGNDDSFLPSISADGRFVAFYSRAVNLVDGDTNSDTDVFVHDRATATTTRVSVSTAGAQGDQDSVGASISADGRYVAFQSFASNLVSGDTNNTEDIFVHDRMIGETTLITRGGNDQSQSATISADGRYVAFRSYATNLVAGDTNESSDIFVHDRMTGETTLASVSSDGFQSNDFSTSASISANGRYVAFGSLGSNLVGGDENMLPDIFVRDRETQTTERVSLCGLPFACIGDVGGNGLSLDPQISSDGRFVAFHSEATNLIDNDENGVTDLFVRDRQTGNTTLVSSNPSGEGGNGPSLFAAIAP